MKIADLMSKEVITVEIPSDRREALKLMVKFGISGLPVIDARTKHVVGIITRKDIFKRVDEDQLALIMTQDPLTVRPNDEPALAARLMVQHGIRRLPVIDAGELEGIVTPTDLMGIIEQYGTGTVGEYMGRRCVPIFDETPLPVVLAIIHATQTYAMPILDSDAEIVGIITDGDMFQEGMVDDSVVVSDLGIGGDEDSWTWEGLRNVMKLYYISSKIELPNIPVKDLMIKDLITVFRETSIQKTAKLMRHHGLGQIPVVDDDGRLGGMIFSMDVLKWFLQEGEGYGKGV